MDKCSLQAFSIARYSRLFRVIQQIRAHKQLPIVYYVAITQFHHDQNWLFKIHVKCLVVEIHSGKCPKNRDRCHWKNGWGCGSARTKKTNSFPWSLFRNHKESFWDPQNMFYTWATGVKFLIFSWKKGQTFPSQMFWTLSWWCPHDLTFAFCDLVCISSCWW